MSAAPDQLQMFTIDETARLLAISPETVRRLLVCGELRGRRVGNRWRVSRAALEEWELRGEKPVGAVVQMRGRR